MFWRLFIESFGFMLSGFSWLNSVRNCELATAQLQDLKSLGWQWWQILFVDTFLLQIYPGVVELYFSPVEELCHYILSLWMNPPLFHLSDGSFGMSVFSLNSTFSDILQVLAQIPWKFPCQLRGFLMAWTYPLKVPFICKAQLWTLLFIFQFTTSC